MNNVTILPQQTAPSLLQQRATVLAQLIQAGNHLGLIKRFWTALPDEDWCVETYICDANGISAYRVVWKNLWFEATHRSLAHVDPHHWPIHGCAGPLGALPAVLQYVESLIH